MRISKNKYLSHWISNNSIYIVSFFRNIISKSSQIDSLKNAQDDPRKNEKERETLFAELRVSCYHSLVSYIAAYTATTYTALSQSTLLEQTLAKKQNFRD